MRQLDGLRVKLSTVAGAGYGLFAARGFAKGDHLADYTGDELIIRRDGDGGLYCLQFTKRESIDAARTNTGYGRWANDPRGTGRGPNASSSSIPRAGTGRLRATQAHPRGRGDLRQLRPVLLERVRPRREGRGETGPLHRGCSQT